MSTVIPSYLTTRLHEALQKNVPDLDPNDQADSMVLENLYQALPDELKAHFVWHREDCKSAAKYCTVLGTKKLCNEGYWEYASLRFFHLRAKPFVNFSWQINYKIHCLHHDHDHLITDPRNIKGDDFDEAPNRTTPGMGDGVTRIFSKTYQYPSYFKRCSSVAGDVSCTKISTRCYPDHSVTKLSFYAYSDSVGEGFDHETVKRYYTVVLEARGAPIGPELYDNIIENKWLPLLNSPDWVWLFRGDAVAPEHMMNQVKRIEGRILED